MKVFISYGDTADQVTALRLQALGAANGLIVYVPPAYTRRGVAALLDPDAAQKLNEADVILGIVSAGLTLACRQELNSELALRKNMIVMSYPAFAARLLARMRPQRTSIKPALITCTRFTKYGG